jgi:penicillin amidase
MFNRPRPSRRRNQGSAIAVFICLIWTVQTAISYSSPAPIQSSDLAARAKAALAQTSGRIELEGISKPVEVLRDEWGVPHIYAEKVEDLFFAQGFVAAQDRLWQMEIWRRIGEGNLAEILGPQAIERDRFARLMRYRGDMNAEWKSYSPDAKSIIEAFVRGVNAFIRISRDRLPIEFQLTGISPELWTAETCLTRMAGYVMTRNASSEILRAQVAHKFGIDKAEEWLETDPFKKLEIPSGLNLEGIDSKILASASAASGSVSFNTNNPNDGSNNWVINGQLSATGKPLLANDPHRAITLPSLRYLVHLVGPGWNVIGAGEPSLPGVAAGHNETVGFGFTIVGIDQQDIYVEETDPKDPTLYRAGSKWEKMKVEREEIKVKDRAAPEILELKFTRHGPVIHEDRARNRAYVLRWVGTEPGTAGYLASLSLNRAKNWKEFLVALERWKVPSENLVYADTDGNIGWQAAGITPIRRGWSGLVPVPGGSGKYEWNGFLPLSELPRSYNPQSGFIATANHKVIPEGYRREIGFEWAAPFRFHRIEEVLKKGSKFTVADFERLQYDEDSIIARKIVPMLRGISFEDARSSEAARMLLDWNMVLTKDSVAATVYEMWLSKLTPNIFKPTVPAEAWSMVGGRFSVSQLIAALTNPTTKIFGPDPQKGRMQVLAASLTEAVAELSKRLGPDSSKWQWGNLHQAEFKHMLSRDEATRAVFDLRSVPSGGDSNTVKAAAGPGFRHSHGASFRQILDVSNWDNSVATSVPGQSGQPGSPHYSDLLPLWAEGKFFPLLFSRSKVESHTKQRLRLEPKKDN